MEETKKKETLSPKVGVGVFITSGDYLLLAKRQNSHGAGSWTFPGGHLEFKETVRDAAIRETKEEAGLELNPNDISELGFTQDIFENENKHYITIFLRCDLDKALVKPIRLEPDKFSTEWEWFHYLELPTPLFISVENALDEFGGQLFVRGHCASSAL